MKNTIEVTHYLGHKATVNIDTIAIVRHEESRPSRAQIVTTGGTLFTVIESYEGVLELIEKATPKAGRPRVKA